MTINELKLKIENKVDISEPVIFKIIDDDFIKKHEEYQKSKPCYSELYTARNPKLSDDMKNEMASDLLKKDFGYVE